MQIGELFILAFSARHPAWLEEFAERYGLAA